MQTYKIVNGAERNAGNGFVLAIETAYGDKLYVTGFPPEAKLKIYQVGDGVTEPLRKNQVVVPVNEVASRLKRVEDAARELSEYDNGGL